MSQELVAGAQGAWVAAQEAQGAAQAVIAGAWAAVQAVAQEAQGAAQAVVAEGRAAVQAVAQVAAVGATAVRHR